MDLFAVVMFLTVKINALHSAVVTATQFVCYGEQVDLVIIALACFGKCFGGGAGRFCKFVACHHF